MACDPDFVFGIAGHTMTVIEADGVNHEPLVVDSIHIYGEYSGLYLVSGYVPRRPHTSSYPILSFSLDKWTPFPYSALSLHPLKIHANLRAAVGQRYSFILTANQPVSNYWIRAIPNYGTIDIVNGTNR